MYWNFEALIPATDQSGLSLHRKIIYILHIRNAEWIYSEHAESKSCVGNTTTRNMQIDWVKHCKKLSKEIYKCEETYRFKIVQIYGKQIQNDEFINCCAVFQIPRSLVMSAVDPSLTYNHNLNGYCDFIYPHIMYKFAGSKYKIMNSLIVAWCWNPSKFGKVCGGG